MIYILSWHGIVFFLLRGINHEQVNNAVELHVKDYHLFIEPRSNLRTKFHRIQKCKPSSLNITIFQIQHAHENTTHLYVRYRHTLAVIQIKTICEDLSIYQFMFFPLLFY